MNNMPQHFLFYQHLVKNPFKRSGSDYSSERKRITPEGEPLEGSGRSRSLVRVIVPVFIGITDAIKFVQTNKEKLMFAKKEENGKESKELDYDDDKDQVEEKQQEKIYCCRIHLIALICYELRKLF
jgi:hypothetical protein